MAETFLNGLNPSVPTTTSATDTIDPADLTQDSDFTKLAGVRQEIVSVGLRRPKRDEFIRTSPDDALWIPRVGLIEDRKTGEFTSSSAAAGKLRE